MDGWAVLLAVREATGDIYEVSFSAFSSTLEAIRTVKFESIQLRGACFGLPRPNLSIALTDTYRAARLGGASNV